MSSDSCNSRAIGPCYLWQSGLRMNLWGKKNGDRAERNWITDMECLESGPPLVSIEDRTVVGSADRV